MGSIYLLKHLQFNVELWYTIGEFVKKDWCFYGRIKIY